MHKHSESVFIPLYSKSRYCGLAHSVPDASVTGQLSYLQSKWLLWRFTHIYLCLDHFHPLLSESADDASDVHLSFAVGLLQSHVQGNERPRSPNPSTAVYQDRSAIRVPLAHHTLVEGHEGSGIFWNAIIGPRHELVLRYGQEVIGVFTKLKQP